MLFVPGFPPAPKLARPLQLESEWWHRVLDVEVHAYGCEGLVRPGLPETRFGLLLHASLSISISRIPIIEAAPSDRSIHRWPVQYFQMVRLMTISATALTVPWSAQLTGLADPALINSISRPFSFLLGNAGHMVGSGETAR